ncbi:predicted protein [Naegleria gruberi]|uniref:Predicted protein n=1 Tax=Naegleria gruberi TaxID=5762 RepID=D2VK01_NAEGR|nr:uncharacterized protein NAEGRDRAFT_69221 [Naegleria gruberi]EFC42861.1 predicted protein [Naegleria gruberi]|eukprot:XP_002675605.1 predicted protein [Naegleria gruberi strain NEG-M]
MITATRNFSALLDELMGVNRNGDRQDLIIEHFTDPRVCKYDLLGLCPYKLFPNTKFDLGPCPFLCCPVPPKFKKQFEEEKKTLNFDYEHKLEQILAQIQDNCDEKIAKAQSRLDVQHKKDLNKNNEPLELQNIKKEIDKVTKQIEELTTEGEYEEAHKLMERLDSLKKEKETVEAKAPTQKIGDTQELIVCEICGALLSVNESDQRLADHFAGKAHLGFQKVREKLKELRENRTFNDKRQLIADRDHYKQMKGNDYNDYYELKRKRPENEPVPQPSEPASYAPSSSSSSSYYSHDNRSSSHDNRRDNRGGHDDRYSSGGGGRSSSYNGGGGGYRDRGDRRDFDNHHSSSSSSYHRDDYRDRHHSDSYSRSQHDYRRR